MEKTSGFGERLKEVRVSKKLTQVTLAEKAGLNPHTIKDYEAGRRHPAMSTLGILAEALGVSESDLLNDSAPLTKPLHLPLSETLKRFASVPEDIYEIAEKYGADHEVWKDIRRTFEIYEMDIERKRAKAAKANHA